MDQRRAKQCPQPARPARAEAFRTSPYKSRALLQELRGVRLVVLHQRCLRTDVSAASRTERSWRHLRPLVMPAAVVRCAPLPGRLRHGERRRLWGAPKARPRPRCCWLRCCHRQPQRAPSKSPALAMRAPRPLHCFFNIGYTCILAIVYTFGWLLLAGGWLRWPRTQRGAPKLT